MYFVTANPEDIVPENLPDCPVIIKANHNSSGGVIVRDKQNTNWIEIQERF